MICEGDYKTAITQAVTILGGIFLSFAFRTQLFNGAMSEFYEGLVLDPTLDMVLTGILFSRGSNYISDLISRLIGEKNEQNAFEDTFDDPDEYFGEV
jgi:hypothetical protein